MEKGEIIVNCQLLFANLYLCIKRLALRLEL
jgi:hypothetical protein